MPPMNLPPGMFPPGMGAFGMGAPGGMNAGATNQKEEHDDTSQDTGTTAPTRPDTSRRQRKRLLQCPQVIALVPLKNAPEEIYNFLK